MAKLWYLVSKVLAPELNPKYKQGEGKEECVLAGGKFVFKKFWEFEIIRGLGEKPGMWKQTKDFDI